MATFQHPESLNLLQRYKQARHVLRTTSRSSNPAWYQDALELDLQLHIRVDGPSVTSFFFDRHKAAWSAGPELNESHLRDPAKMEALAAEVLKRAHGFKASSLGLVLYLADEFATAEMKPELDNPAALPDLREAAYHKPASILDDSSVPPDQSSWRVIPYPGQGGSVIGTTVTVTRQYSQFIEVFRQVGETNNFPMITRALSAPLVAAMGMAQAAPIAADRAFVTILQYPWFTVLFFFNDHADLLLIRTLQHRHLRHASQLGHALTATNASLELTDPDMFVVPLGADVDAGVHNILTQAFPASKVTVVTPVTVEGVIPAWCPEPVIAAIPPAQEQGIHSLTFSIFRDEQWALQDFLPTPKAVVDLYPNRAEMQLLRAARLVRLGLFAVTVLFAAWFSVSIFDIVRREEWAFDPSDANKVKGRLQVLNTERQKGEQWDNLLADRSKAWSSMELLARLFPERCGVLVKSYSHTVRPDIAPGLAKFGFVKEWKIIGYARDEALDRLNMINTQEGISAHFSEISRVTGNSAFNPAVGNRSVAVNVRTQENNMYKPLPVEETYDTDDSSYPYTFDLTITQRFEASDPMAVTVTKAP